MRLKQSCFLLICFIADVILCVSCAVIHFNNGVIIFALIALLLFVTIIVLISKTEKASEKAWNKVLGQTISFNTKIVFTNEDSIEIKRDGRDETTIQKLTDIINIEKFGSTIIIMFLDNTSVIFSNNSKSNDLEKILSIEQIKNKRIVTQKTFVNKLSIQLSLCSIILAFLVSYLLSDAITLNLAAWVQYSYIMYIFLLVPLTLFIISIIMKCKKGATVAVLALVLISLFGSFRFFFDSQINYETTTINNIERRLNYDLPEAERLITQDGLYYTYSIGKFNNSNLLSDFENKIKSEDKWINNLDNLESNTINQTIKNRTKRFDCFLIYNENNQAYYNFEQNNIELKNCILFAYNTQNHTFFIIFNIK